jgi:hypothetical protein
LPRGILRCDASAPAAGPGPSAGSAAAAEATGWSRWNGHCSTLRLQVLETTYLFSPHPAGGPSDHLRVDLGPSTHPRPSQSRYVGYPPRIWRLTGTLALRQPGAMNLNRITRRLSYSNVIASLALFVALGGASYAAVALPANSVGTKQLKKSAVSASKLKRNAVSSAKVKDGSGHCSRGRRVPSDRRVTPARTARPARRVPSSSSTTSAMDRDRSASSRRRRTSSARGGSRMAATACRWPRGSTPPQAARRLVLTSERPPARRGTRRR